MDRNRLDDIVQELQSILPWVIGISTPQEYKQAIELMDELTDDAESNELLINLLFLVIERYEATALEFQNFSKNIEPLDSGKAVLNTLIDQYNLSLSDFKHEIGDESAVAEILGGTRELTKAQIKGLSERFTISPAMFF
ncbi:helix-turn-helix domain-containing protein [Vibrio astriarenae]